MIAQASQQTQGPTKQLARQPNSPHTTPRDRDGEIKRRQRENRRYMQRDAEDTEGAGRRTHRRGQVSPVHRVAVPVDDRLVRPVHLAGLAADGGAGEARRRAGRDSAGASKDAGGAQGAVDGVVVRHRERLMVLAVTVVVMMRCRRRVIQDDETEGRW